MIIILILFLYLSFVFDQFNDHIYVFFYFLWVISKIHIIKKKYIVEAFQHDIDWLLAYCTSLEIHKTHIVLVLIPMGPNSK